LLDLDWCEWELLLKLYSHKRIEHKQFESSSILNREEGPGVWMNTHLLTANLIGDTLKHTEIHAHNLFPDCVTDLGVLSGVGNHESVLVDSVIIRAPWWILDAPCASSYAVT
jgi:hypothetical protein